MKIIKRDCSEVEFDKNKIYDAIMKAMTFGSGIIKPEIAKEIAAEIESEAEYIKDLDIYTVESMVFEKLVGKNEILTAKAYEGYRRVREFQRDTKNSTDESIMELLSGESDYWNNENSNKNAMLVTTQRDYMAGIESEDISTKRATTGSAGYDFSLPIAITLAPQETAKIPTGIRVRIDDGWVLKAYPRSGLGFKYRLQLDNTVGIIDSDYYNSDNEGHIFAKITNDSYSEKTVELKDGDTFMQGIFVEYGITTDDNADGIRNGGFGSTGAN